MLVKIPLKVHQLLNCRRGWLKKIQSTSDNQFGEVGGVGSINEISYVETLQSASASQDGVGMEVGEIADISAGGDPGKNLIKSTSTS